MARTYADAVECLNTLQSNFAVVDAIRKSGRKMNERAISEMVEWLGKIGYEPSNLDRLNCIHIAGTKGKGSTAAFVSSILKQYNAVNGAGNPRSLRKIGLYTSPHLRFVRERIQINGKPLSEEQFTKYFFETWDRLEQAANVKGSEAADPSSKPVYFRFLTLMAFHTYLSEGVDAAIIECGIGGAYDSTNIISTPIVTGITSLGIDHQGVLGDSLEEIAWHKSGIMKESVPCFTPSSQKPAAKTVMENIAPERGAELVYVDLHPEISKGTAELGLDGEFQKINASLAVAIAGEWLNQTAHEHITRNGHLNERFRRGLKEVEWGGRCETRSEGQHLTWFIDGGHTLDSIAYAGRWYAEQIRKKPGKGSSKPASFLIFNQQTRDADALASALHATLLEALNDKSPFTHAIFCTNTTFKAASRPDLMYTNANAADISELKVQKQLASTWDKIDPECHVEVVRTIEEAVEMVRVQAKEGTAVTAFVTGSLHLVGGFLEVSDVLEQN